MELDAFTNALGNRQGRIPKENAHVLVLGDVEAGRRHELTPGDYVEWAQDVDLTGELLVRVQGSLRAPSRMPEHLTWEVSLTVNDAKRARLIASPGRSQRVDDLVCFVGDLAGFHRVAIRLELVEADG